MSFQSSSIGSWLSKLRDFLIKDRYAQGIVQRYTAVVRCFLAHLHERRIEVDRARLEDVDSYLQTRLRLYREKRKALDQLDMAERLTKPPRWKRDAGLLAWLESL